MVQERAGIKNLVSHILYKRFSVLGETTMEDKQKICDLLVPVLQETRDFQELESLKYNKDNETVVATFWYGAVKTANVHMDSGTSMIRDIIEQIR